MSASRRSAISSPCGTASAPPGAKSFWKSMIRRASGIGRNAMARGPPSAYGQRMRRIALLAALAATATAAVAGCGGSAVRRADGAAAAAAAAPAAAAAEPRWPDRARYVLDLAYDRRRFALSGTERIAFTNSGPDPLPTVWLRAWANAFGGCGAHRAQLRVTAGGRLGARRRACTAVEVRLDRPVAPGAQAVVTLRIRITAPPRADRFGRFAGAAY